MTTISRRHLLAGLTAAGILAPFARGIRKAHAQSASKAKAIFVYVPDGCIPSKWHPTGSERNFQLQPMTEPLAAVQQHITFLKGIDMYAGGATHEGGVRKVLTGVSPLSLDIFLGQQLPAMPHSSIQLGIGSNFQNGSGSMSFIGEGQEVKHDDDPLNAFTRIFGAPPGQAGGGNEDPAVVAAKRRRRSILDLAVGDLDKVKGKLGSTERAKLDTHLESLREVERRLDTTPGAACSVAEFDTRGYRTIETDYYPKTWEKEEEFQRVGELQMDIAALALSCQLTRVVSIMWSHPVSPTRIAATGVGVNNHDASHYGDPNSPTAASFISLKRWFMDRFVYLIQRLESTPDPDGGTLLDNAVVFLCSELGDSNLHDHRNMPFLIAGHGGGRIAGGRLLDYTGQVAGENQPHAKILVSIANAMGVDINEYGHTGHGTGPLPGLLG